MAKQTDKLEALQELFDNETKMLNNKDFSTLTNGIKDAILELFKEQKRLFNEAITQERELAFNARNETENKRMFPNYKKYDNFTEYNKTQKLIK